MSALDVTEVSFAVHMLILLYSLCCLLQEILATHYMKLSAATVNCMAMKENQLLATNKSVHNFLIHVLSILDFQGQRA